MNNFKLDFNLSIDLINQMKLIQYEKFKGKIDTIKITKTRLTQEKNYHNIMGSSLGVHYAERQLGTKSFSFQTHINAY